MALSSYDVLSFLKRPSCRREAISLLVHLSYDRCQPRLPGWLSPTVHLGGYSLLSQTYCTRDKQARSHTEQQGGHRLQRCHEDRVVGAPLKGLGQRTVWRFSCQPGDGAPAWLDERCTGGNQQEQTDQRDGDPAGPEAPRGQCQVEPGDKDEQHADADKVANGTA